MQHADTCERDGCDEMDVVYEPVRCSEAKRVLQQYAIPKMTRKTQGIIGISSQKKGAARWHPPLLHEVSGLTEVALFLRVYTKFV